LVVEVAGCDCDVVEMESVAAVRILLPGIVCVVTCYASMVIYYDGGQTREVDFDVAVEGTFVVPGVGTT